MKTPDELIRALRELADEAEDFARTCDRNRQWDEAAERLDHAELLREAANYIVDAEARQE